MLLPQRLNSISLFFPSTTAKKNQTTLDLILREVRELKDKVQELSQAQAEAAAAPAAPPVVLSQLINKRQSGEMSPSRQTW